MTDALLTQYVIESRECLEAASDALLVLEKSPDSAASIDHLFRALHTLKGNAALFAFIPVVRVTHVAEDILGAIVVFPVPAKPWTPTTRLRVVSTSWAARR